MLIWGYLIVKKNNIRSFRFSDEVLCKLQKAKGDSLNEKFENLVNGCFKKLPQIEKRVKELEQYRNDLYSEVCSLKKEKLRLSEELSEIRDIQRELMSLALRICDIKDNL